MTHALWRRKISVGRSKGVSTVIGTIFLVIVVFLISTNIFIWTISQNNLYNQAVRESHQMDADRFSERVIAYDGNCSVPVPGGNVQVTGILANQGPISAQVLTLWVLDETNKKYNVTDLRERNYNLNPGDNLTITIEVMIPEASSNHTINSWFVTARGNLVPLEKEEEIIAIARLAALAQGFGSIGLDFYTFRYFEYASSVKLKNYPGGTVSFDVPTAKNIAFAAILENLDPEKRVVTLDSHSQLWLYFPKSAKSIEWYIVNVASDGTIAPTYSPISIEYGVKKLIVFASSSDGSFNAVSIPAGYTSETGTINLVLHGTLGGKPYGQNIPFVSIFTT